LELVEERRTKLRAEMNTTTDKLQKNTSELEAEIEKYGGANLKHAVSRLQCFRMVSEEVLSQQTKFGSFAGYVGILKGNMQASLALVEDSKEVQVNVEVDISNEEVLNWVITNYPTEKEIQENIKKHAIAGALVMQLTEEDLKELGFSKFQAKRWINYWRSASDNYTSKARKGHIGIMLSPYQRAFAIQDSTSTSIQKSLETSDKKQPA